MKKSVIIFIFLISAATFSQTNLYLHPNSDSYVKNTKTIAILPLETKVRLRPLELKKYTPNQLIQLNKRKSLYIQKTLYSWLLKRKKRGSLLVEIQNPEITNELLKKNNLNIHSLDQYLPTELGKILEVETIIRGSFETSKPLSGFAAAGIEILTGLSGLANTATLNMEFLSTVDNALVVKYDKTINGGMGSNASTLIDNLMRKVSRKIPFTK